MATRAAQQPWPLVVCLFFIASLVETLGMGHLSAFMPVYLHQDLHVGASAVPLWIAFSTALEFVLGLPLVPLWGVWADILGRKAVIARSAYVEALVFLLVGLSHGVALFAVALVFVGFQLGNTGIMLAAIRAATPTPRVGLAVSLFGLAGPIGLAVGPALGGYFVDRLGISLHVLFYLDSLLSLVSGLMLTLLYQDVRPAGRAMGRILPRAYASVRKVFATRRILHVFAVFGLVIFGRQMVGPFLPLLVEHIHPARFDLLSTIGLVTGTAALVGALFSPLAGMIGDRAGFQKVLLAAVFSMGVSFLLMAVTKSILWLAVLSALFSACTSVTFAMVFALLATTLDDMDRGPALNLVYVPLYVSGMIGPVLAGVVAHIDLRLLFIVAALFAFVGAFVVWRSMRKSARGQPAVTEATG